jgi:hypothetical protein
MNEETKPKKGRKAKVETVIPKGRRDERGLISGPDYEFDQYGFINWRKLVNPEHIVLNRMEMGKSGIDVKLITEEEKQKYLAEVPDSKKVIRLAGFRELARLRGFTEVAQMIKPADGAVLCECTITFVPNIETDFTPLVYTAVASASPADVAPDYAHFLAAIASNRAFGRCVREALGIVVVTEEELNPNEETKVATGGIKPNDVLERKCKDKGISVEVIKTWLAGQGYEIEMEWLTFKDFPVPIAMAALDADALK